MNLVDSNQVHVLGPIAGRIGGVGKHLRTKDGRIWSRKACRHFACHGDCDHLIDVRGGYKPTSINIISYCKTKYYATHFLKRIITYTQIELSGRRVWLNVQSVLIKSCCLRHDGPNRFQVYLFTPKEATLAHLLTLRIAVPFAVVITAFGTTRVIVSALGGGPLSIGIYCVSNKTKQK